MVKIGLASDIGRRLRNIQSLCPTKVYCILYTQPANESLERGTHMRFREQRKHGEWFSVEGKLAQYLEPFIQDPSNISYDPDFVLQNHFLNTRKFMETGQ